MSGVSAAHEREMRQVPLPPWPGELLEAGDRSLFVRRADSGEPGSRTLEPAVFVHGLDGSSRNWTDLMGLLRARVQAVAPDLPGFGHSPPPPDDDYSPRAHASAVARLVRSMGTASVHLVGNSLGGAVATRVAAEQPQLVRTLTLVSPALPELLPRRSTAQLGLLAVPGLGSLLARRLTSRPVHQRVEAFLDLVFADSSTVPDVRRREAADEMRRRALLPHAEHAMAASLRGLIAEYLSPGRNGMWQLAARVDAPALVVYGGRDKLVHARMARRAARTFRRARVVVLPRSGHVAQIEHPDLVANAFTELLAAHPSG